MFGPGKVYAGSVVRLTAHFETDVADVDPATVTLTTRRPDDTEATYVYGTDANVGKSSVGDYYADITATMPGRWHYRWLTTGSGTTVAMEGSFNCQGSAFVDDAYASRDYN